jgi:hypothetical protein
MSVFVFDKDTLDMMRYLLAMKRFKDYSIGPQGVELHLCVYALERVLIQTGLNYPKFQKENPRDLQIYDIVKFLQQKNIITPTLANQLIEYVAFHDTLMRTGAQIINESANATAKELLRFLCAEAGINIEKETKEREFDDIASLKTGQLSENSKYEVEETDFDSLDRLYDKCGFIQREIEKKLTAPLKPARVSGFTPNTGGIWIPFVTREAPDKRAHIERACLGVTFTPTSIRIGLDFGVQAHKYRIKYYNLLLEGKMTDEIESLSRKATGYCLCDTYWYYHTRNIQSLQWCLTLYGSTKLAFENAIEETRQLEGGVLTAHRYLICKVIDRRPEDFNYAVKGLINEASRTLNELYPIIRLIEES